MSEAWFLQPPEIVEVDKPVVFLAGPIQGAPEWQSQAASMIHEQNPELVVASPRRDYEADSLEFVYEKQVDWETYFLRKAGSTGLVLFWLARQTIETPGRAYAQTTRFELAEWKMKHQFEGAKLVVGIEPGFGNERYIRRRLSQDAADVPILSSLEDTCRAAVELLSA